MTCFKKIPFQLGAEILLRSPSNPSHKAKSKVIGVLEKEFIMIVDPVFAISDYITAIVEDNLMVAYLHEGYLFTFKSRFNKKLLNDIICIDYPQDFQVEQMRKEVRVKVNLEAKLAINDLNISGFVKDISESGAFFELPKIISTFKGIKFTATFTLPNDETIKDLQCEIMSVRYNQIHRKTGIGVSFSGPVEETSKIRELVRFCMRFKV
jgi:c-di-GMP-binding flagellar brake protein YcgR